MIYVIIGILLGTFGLAWSHHLVHKYNLFNISVVWKNHISHHDISNDPEFKQKCESKSVFHYALYRVFRVYLKPTEWKTLDFVVLVLCLLHPPLIITTLVALYIAECIGYLQHTFDNYPVDFNNKFDNWVGLNCGKHTEHHGYNEVKYSTDTEVIFGLLCMHTWLLICLVMYPLLILSRRPANIPGVYKFGLLQNIANYKAVNGAEFKKLLWKAPSIFDKPIILVQLIKAIFATKAPDSDHLHDISDARNIYAILCINSGSPIVHEGIIYDGHHRHAALKKLKSEITLLKKRNEL